MVNAAALIAVYLQTSIALTAALEQQPPPKTADGAAAASGFDYDDLSLREVGARNTRVRGLLFPIH